MCYECVMMVLFCCYHDGDGGGPGVGEHSSAGNAFFGMLCGMLCDAAVCDGDST
jgi:hypothetical protein